jgi:hypothetical protein
MNDDQITEIQAILSDVGGILRERLAAIGLNIPHIMLAIAPDGAGVVRSSVGPEGLADMAELLAAIAIEAATHQPDNDPLN